MIPTDDAPFDTIWHLWPRSNRGARWVALQTWLRLRPDAELAAVIVASAAALAARGGAMPRLHSWLAVRGWERPDASAAEVEAEARVTARRRSQFHERRWPPH
jgi:hypothetical protein